MVEPANLAGHGSDQYIQLAANLFSKSIRQLRLLIVVNKILNVVIYAKWAVNFMEAMTVNLLWSSPFRARVHRDGRCVRPTMCPSDFVGAVATALKTRC